MKPLIDTPRRVVLPCTDGTFLATNNFNRAIPIWRVYKKYGWAVRYANGKSSRKKSGQTCRYCKAILAENLTYCDRCGKNKG